MTAVLQSPSHLASSPSSQLSCSSNDALQTLLTSERINRSLVGIEEESEREREREISILALLVSVVRRSLAHCKAEGEGEDLHPSMEIGWPTEVRHVAHVTFDRFHGFLGLPVEFEPEVPRRAPSASATVFGVSTESMQCSYDSRGNSVPTILVLLQRRLYERGGLQAEGIFRINPGNSQEEYVRDQLNSGIVPDGIDVHCLAGLIKAWFRELPTGVLDPLTPEQVMQCQTEEECAQVVKLLPSMESALLDWAINLMADVVQEEEKNKMNARNVAMVFAPNMTQMADPLNALMYAVQVMNFLRMLILKTLKARKESTSEEPSRSHANPSDENGHESPQLPLEACNDEAIKQVFVDEEPILDVHTQVAEDNDSTLDSSHTSYQDVIAEETIREIIVVDSSSMDHVNSQGAGKGKLRNTNLNKGTRNDRGPSPVKTILQAEISKGAIIASHINSRVERIEAWRALDVDTSVHQLVLNLSWLLFEVQSLLKDKHIHHVLWMSRR